MSRRHYRSREHYCYATPALRVLKNSQLAAETLQVHYFTGLERRITHHGNRQTEDLQVITLQGVRILHWQQGKPAAIVNPQLRFSVTNHADSALIELDDQGALLSREIFYPFGGTAYWASHTSSPARYKTLRYSGKERDISGLLYYGCRYYAPWLRRWLNADPAGTVDGLNLYAMVRNNPVTLVDKQGTCADEHCKLLPSDVAPGMDTDKVMASIKKNMPDWLIIYASHAKHPRQGASAAAGNKYEAAFRVVGEKLNKKYGVGNIQPFIEEFKRAAAGYTSTDCTALSELGNIYTKKVAPIAQTPELKAQWLRTPEIYRLSEQQFNQLTQPAHSPKPARPKSTIASGCTPAAKRNHEGKLIWSSIAWNRQYNWLNLKNLDMSGFGWQEPGWSEILSSHDEVESMTNIYFGYHILNRETGRNYAELSSKQFHEKMIIYGARYYDGWRENCTRARVTEHGRKAVYAYMSWATSQH